MSDRPTSPEPAPQPRPAAGTPAPPSVDPAATAPLPPQAGQPPQGAAVPPVDPSRGWPAQGASVATPARGGPRRWWADATSTGAGRGALIAVAVLAALLLITGVGLTAAFVARHAGPGRGIAGWSSDDGAPGMGLGRGNGKGWGQGNGRPGNGMMRGDDGLSQGRSSKPGRGNGNGLGLGRGAAMLGAGVLHGEFTTTVTGTPTVMVVQTGQVTAYTAGKSLTVKSTDGFQATYTLDSTVVQDGGAGTLATGVQVRVLASKAGMKVTALSVG